MEGRVSFDLDRSTGPSRNLKRFSSCGKTARQPSSFLLSSLAIPLSLLVPSLTIVNLISARVNNQVRGQKNAFARGEEFQPRVTLYLLCANERSTEWKPRRKGCSEPPRGLAPLYRVARVRHDAIEETEESA